MTPYNLREYTVDKAHIQTMDLLKEIIPSMILAPSAHNTQPWLFSIREDAIEVYVDWSRHLRISDPSHRQLYSSLGCAVQNGLVAAAHHGLHGRPETFPDGEGSKKPAIRLTFSAGQPDASLGTLFEAIASRRTDRSLYDGKPLTADEKKALTTLDSEHMVVIEDTNAIKQIASLTEEGTTTTLSRADFKGELSQWVRNSWTHKPDGMPGYAMGIPALISLMIPIMVKVAPIHKQEGPKARQQIASASLIVVITSKSDQPADCIGVGQALQKLWLEATLAGLAAAPHASAVEASANIRERLQRAIGTSNLPQAVLRIGHSKHHNLRATPRRTVADCLKP